MSNFRSAETTSGRPRDEIWDTLTEHFGEPRTKSERGRRNAAVRELRQAEATVEEVRIALDYCTRHFTSFTEMACCSWLSRALREAEESRERRAVVMELFRQAEER